MLFITFLQSLVYPASTAFRSGRGVFIVLSLLHSLSVLALFWIFAGPGVILYFFSVLLAFIFAVRHRNRKDRSIRYALRIPVVLVPLALSILGGLNIAASYRDFRDDEILRAQIDRGEALAKVKCSVCHALKGDLVKVGPSLGGVYMRKIGSKEGFNYSEAFKNADSVWTEKELDAFLAGVPTYLKGSNMIIQSIEDESERKALIAYLIGNSKARKRKPGNKGTETNHK